mgnify:CR=1 FL=1
MSPDGDHHCVVCGAGCGWGLKARPREIGGPITWYCRAHWPQMPAPLQLEPKPAPTAAKPKQGWLL